MPRDDLYMRYLGALGILADVAVYVPEEERERIEMAMADAAAHYLLKWRRILDRIEIEPAS